MSFPPDSQEMGKTDGQYGKKIHNEVLKSIFNIPKIIQNVYVIVKPHPVESSLPFDAFLKNDKTCRIRVAYDFSAYETLNCSELAISVFSTTGFEAVLLNKLLIVLKLTRREEIINYIEDQNIDLVIMGTHGRKGMDKVIFGSVAERVLKTSPVPVMVVNPYKTG